LFLINTKFSFFPWFEKIKGIFFKLKLALAF